MALLWRDFLCVRPGDGTVLAPGQCDAVESATQKEIGGVLSRSPKNKKKQLRLQNFVSLSHKCQAPHIIGEIKRNGRAGNSGGV